MFIRSAAKRILMSVTLALFMISGMAVFTEAVRNNFSSATTQVSAFDRVLHAFGSYAWAEKKKSTRAQNKKSKRAQSKKSKASTKWTCPMHPHYIADEFGSCPICGMDLVKLETPGEAQGATTATRRNAITIAPETMQNIGVRLGKAEVSSFGRIIRSYGRVAENERLQSELTARLEGWIEDLRVRAVGDHVKKGDLLFTLYAPEYIVSQRDYFAARKGRNGARINSIKRRLRAFGMQDRAIKEMAKKGSVMEFVPFYAELDGTVAMIDLRPGSYVKRGTMLTRIQDYSQVWLMVSVPEKDLSFIKVGTPAVVTFPNIPGREVFARVEYVYPTVDAQTRTGQVRLVMENKDGQLRPGAYADVAFQVGTQKRLAVPSEAILKSGSGRYVLVSLGGGRFEPRAVKLGLTSERWTEVSGEIEDGDDIVVSGQFLIDSESALRESFQKLERLKLPFALLKLDKTQFAMVDHIVDASLYMHEALTDGYDVDPKQLEPAIEVKTLLWPAFQHTRLAYVLADSVKVLEKARSAQTESETQAILADLVNALEPWLMEGAPKHYEDRKVAFYKDAKSGRKWLQLAGKPVNPYGTNEAVLVPWPEIKAVDHSGDANDRGSKGEEETKSDAVPRGSHTGHSSMGVGHGEH